jgi:glycosyltransferase involved in cell wall biosynthesis
MWNGEGRFTRSFQRHREWFETSRDPQRRQNPEWKSEELDSLLDAIRGDPRILLIDREFTRPRAIALLALSDCFLSLHRSEGFGRGPAEAMLLGKPVIVTDYSGTREFATSETALLVDYQLVRKHPAKAVTGDG